MSASTYNNIFYKGTESAITQSSIQDGKIKVATDTGRLYIDFTGSRVEITDFVRGYTDTQIEAIQSPITSKIYIASNTGHMYIYLNNEWIDLNAGGGGGGSVSYPIKTNKGGTGNTVGYIRTGQKSGSTAGNYSTIEGLNNECNDYSHAEGYMTCAYGNNSHAEGRSTCADGGASHAEGYSTYASYDSHAEGYQTCAGSDSHAEGYNTCAKGNYSHVEGAYSSAIGAASHAEGTYTCAGGNYSHAEGNGTTANSIGAHTEGCRCYSYGAGSNPAHAEGYQTRAEYSFTHSEGYNTTAIKIGDHAEGNSTNANGTYSHAEGNATCTAAESSHAEGLSTCAAGDYSHAEGYTARTIGADSHAEGRSTLARGDHSHAEGYGTYAYGSYSHVEGFLSSALVNYGYAAGYKGCANLNEIYAIGCSEDKAEVSYKRLNSNQYYVGHRSDTNNIYTIDKKGNNWKSGATCLQMGECTTDISGTTYTMLLELGAAYILNFSSRTFSTGAYLGAGSCLLASAYHPDTISEEGVATSALAALKEASLGANGTSGISISSTVYNINSKWYTGVVIKSAKNTYHTRWNLVKVIPSCADFNGY